MTRRFTCVLTIAICLGATALLAASNRDVQRQSTSWEAQFAADGAFRDGLYLGKLAAQTGQPLHLAFGRWSTAHNRAMFIAGYRLGHSKVLGVSHESGGRFRTRPLSDQGSSPKSMNVTLAVTNSY